MAASIQLSFLTASPVRSCDELGVFPKKDRAQGLDRIAICCMIHSTDASQWQLPHNHVSSLCSDHKCEYLIWCLTMYRMCSYLCHLSYNHIRQMIFTPDEMNISPL